MRHRVFISHCEKDANVAADICRRIERLGVGCWIAPRDILVGEDFALRVMEAIEMSAVFVIILSHQTNGSHFVKAEAEQAFGCKVPIFPLRIENVEIEKGLKLFLSIAHRVDAFGARRADGIERFVDAVVAKVQKDKGPVRRIGTDWAEVARAIGPGARHFITEWKRADGRKPRMSWTWEAFLAGPFWPFYRGMTLFGVLMVASVAGLVLLGAQMADQADGVLVGLIGGWLLTATIVGVAGSAAYRRHIDAVILSHRQPTPTARTIWMAGSGAALIAILALSVHGGSGPAPVADLSNATVIVTATPAVDPTGGARPGRPDPSVEEAQRQEDLQNAYSIGQADAFNTAMEAGTMETSDSAANTAVDAPENVM